MTEQKDLFAAQCSSSPACKLHGPACVPEVGVTGIMDRNKAYCAECVEVSSYERGFIYTDHPVGRKCEWCGAKL